MEIMTGGQDFLKNILISPEFCDIIEKNITERSFLYEK